MFTRISCILKMVSQLYVNSFDVMFNYQKIPPFSVNIQ